MLTASPSNPTPADPATIARRVAQLVIDFPSLAKLPHIQQRIARAQTIACADGSIFEVAPGIFKVISQSNPLGAYMVNTNAHTCTCPAASQPGPCKHRLAVALFLGWLPVPSPTAAPVEAQPAEEEGIPGTVLYNHPFHGEIKVPVFFLGLVQRHGQPFEHVRARRGEPFDASGFFGPASTAEAWFIPGTFKVNAFWLASRNLRELHAEALVPQHVNHGNKKLAANE